MSPKKIEPKNPKQKPTKKQDADKSESRKTAAGSHRFRKTGRTSSSIRTGH